MKRFTAILLTGMMIFTLASCGKKAQDTPTEPATETQAAEKVEMPTEQNHHLSYTVSGRCHKKGQEKC